jgi:hypothetical protein
MTAALQCSYPLILREQQYDAAASTDHEGWSPITLANPREASMSIAHSYMKLVREHTTWQATFPPGDRVAVGDRLSLKADGSMINLGSVFECPGWSKALPVDLIDAPSSNTWTVGAHRKWVASAQARATMGDDIGAAVTVTVSFSKDGGFELAYTAARTRRFRDVTKAKNLVLAAAGRNEWDPGHALVTEVVDASSATVLVANEKSSQVKLDAHATLPADITGINLADPRLQLGNATWTGSGLAVICSQATPLYHCIRFDPTWWDSNKIIYAGDDPAVLDAAFTAILTYLAFS